MDVIGQFVIGVLITLVGGLILWSHTSLRKDLKADIENLREGQQGLRQELKADINELRSEMAIMRSDITHIALAVGARRPHAEGG